MAKFEIELKGLERLKAEQREVAKLLPLANDVIPKVNRSQVTQFLLELRSVNPGRLIQYIHHLPNNKLNLLFEAMVVAMDDNTLNRLFLVLRERACWSLYPYAWQTLQKHFPNRLLVKAMHFLCKQLLSADAASDPNVGKSANADELRDPEQVHHFPPAISTSDADAELPLERADHASFKEQAIGKAETDASTSTNIGLYRQIPSLYQENLSTVFLQNYTDQELFYALAQPLMKLPADQLDAWQQKYDYQASFVLWQALLGQYFKACPELELFNGRGQLAKLLPAIHPTLAATILTRIHRVAGLNSEQKLQIGQLIFEQLPILTPAHPIWQQVELATTVYYKHLAIQIHLEFHCQNDPNKREFYQPHLIQIKDVAKINEDCIALRFNGFVLIDNRQICQSIYYYDNEAIDELFKQGVEQEQLANPNFELPTPGLDLNLETAINEPALRLDLSENISKISHILLNNAVQRQRSR